MFTPEAIVDAIQNSKKEFVNAFFFGEKFKASLNNFVDAQTEVYKTVISWGQSNFEEVSKKVVNLKK